MFLSSQGMGLFFIIFPIDGYIWWVVFYCIVSFSFYMGGFPLPWGFPFFLDGFSLGFLLKFLSVMETPPVSAPPFLGGAHVLHCMENHPLSMLDDIPRNAVL